MHRIERRYAGAATKAAQNVGVRSGAKGKTLFGYGAVFYNAADGGTQYVLDKSGGKPMLVERIAPGCFDRALREKDDVRFLVNHDPNIILGRVPTTLRLSIDAKGLRFECDAPPTHIAEAVLVGVERGDISGASFAFSVRKQSFVISKNPAAPDVRLLEDVELSDVSCVTFPAYLSASTGARDDSHRHVIRQWQEARAVQLGRAAKIGTSAGAVVFANTPVIDGPWDEDSALERCKRWASTGSGMDHAKLARCFAHSTGESREGAHSLLHHDIAGGKLCVHLDGVRACMRSLDNLDDDDDEDFIPREHRDAVRSHLERHLTRSADGDDDDDRSRLAETARMRARLDEAEAATWRMETADRRRQLERLEAELREARPHSGVSAVPPAMAKMAREAHQRFWGWDS